MPGLWARSRVLAASLPALSRPDGLDGDDAFHAARAWVGAMRTKPVEGVLRMDLTNHEPPELYLAYDGLAGLSLRSMLRDIIEEFQRKGAGELATFIGLVRARRWARIFVYFSDYVSYGIGGGDATAEFFFGTFLMLHEPAREAREGRVPEHLALVRPGATERLSVEGLGV